MSAQTWYDVAELLIKNAVLAGVTDAEVIIKSSTHADVVTRMGETDSVQQARESGVGLRVFVGTRSVVVSGSDVSETALRALVDAAMARVALAPEDRYAGLPNENETADVTPDLDLYDPAVEFLSIEDALALSLTAEAAALAFDPRITNSEGAECGFGCTEELFANSRNVRRYFRSTRIGLHVAPLATEGSVMERDSWYSSKRYLTDLEDPAAIGKRAAARALRRLSAVQANTCKVPIVFEAGAASSLLADLAMALNGYQVYKKSSFLADKLGQTIGSPLLRVYDDPLLRRGPGSRAFDGDGLLTHPLSIVDEGRLVTYLTDTYSARRLGCNTTRNAVRTPSDAPVVGVANLRLRETNTTLDDLIADVKNGVLVTELFGFGVNTTTGSYSRGAAGIWIENGRLTYPVHEFTIASNLSSMFVNLCGVANDAHPDARLSSPSVLISEMTVAGK